MWFFKKKETPEEKGLFTLLKEGLKGSSDKISTGISDIFTKKKLDAAMITQLEELLISADLGPATAAKLARAVGQSRYDREITPEEIKQALAGEIEKILLPAEKPLFSLPGEGRDPACGEAAIYKSQPNGCGPDPGQKPGWTGSGGEGGIPRPFILLMTGVNGTGKTTTIGKLAAQFRAEGKTVMLAAGDTFRAAAVEQLKIWGQRTGCPVVSKDEGADAAALAYEAVERAQAENTDILMIDTAGRLQNKQNLMEELAKIVRVIKKKMPDAPHATILVLDATTGQNAHSQVDLFRQVVPLSGLIVTKLDGTARGGVVVGLVEKFGLPIHAVGVGEGLNDLRPFTAQEYARAIVGG